MQRKPVDVGNGLVCASFGPDGSLLSVGTPHAGAGVVELTAAPAFPAEDDGQGDAVRRHRAGLTEPTHAVMTAAGFTGRLVDHGRWSGHGPGWMADVDAWVMQDRPTVVQRFRVRRHAAGRLTLVLRGRLDRPAYAEITPVGPIPPAWPDSTLSVCGRTVQVSVPDQRPDQRPEVRAVIHAAGHGIATPAWQHWNDTATLQLAWNEDDQDDFELQVCVSLKRTSEQGITPPQQHPSRRAPIPASDAGTDDVLDRIEAGAVRYTAECTALTVEENSCCIITDHRLLPLSWTRDAYYQAAMLLCWTRHEPWPAAVVEQHLAWLWGPGRDAEGVWQRSHFANGAVKDDAYQADQQLYPLLELVDYRRVTDAWPRFPGRTDSGGVAGGARVWGDLVRQVWNALPRGVCGLLPGDENPADDAATFPYLLSSQLLLAYTAQRLAEFENELGIGDLGLAEDAHATLTTVRSAFACDGPYGPQWAYESDGADGRRLYHDANDVPTAVAPLWGLCAGADPRWQATMRFAWSTHNSGFVPGKHGGLGSAHTPGTWPLGDAQRWIVAKTTQDRQAEADLVAKLALVTSDDGMLPETYDPHTGAWVARHWFAWPGSLMGLLHHTVHRGTGPWAAPRPAA